MNAMFVSEGAGLQWTIPLSCGKTGKNEYFRVLKFSSFLRKRNRQSPTHRDALFPRLLEADCRRNTAQGSALTEICNREELMPQLGRGRGAGQGCRGVRDFRCHSRQDLQETASPLPGHVKARL